MKPQPQTKEQIEADLGKADETQIAWMAGQYAVAMLAEYGVTKTIQITGTAIAQIIATEIKPEAFEQVLNKILADVHRVATNCHKIRREAGQ